MNNSLCSGLIEYLYCFIATFNDLLDWSTYGTELEAHGIMSYKSLRFISFVFYKNIFNWLLYYYNEKLLY